MQKLVTAPFHINYFQMNARKIEPDRNQIRLTTHSTAYTLYNKPKS